MTASSRDLSRKTNWTLEEDKFLKNLKESNPNLQWKMISKKLVGQYPGKIRSGKQIRERYMNYLRFDAKCPKNTGWSTFEDETLFKNIMKFGTKWSLICAQMPGRQLINVCRSQNGAKNRFNSILRKIVRKIRTGEKEVKGRYRKPIKYTLLIQILLETHKMQRGEKLSVAFNEQQKQMLNQLGQNLLDFILITPKLELPERTNALIHQIHAYNLMVKEALTRNKNLRNKVVNRKQSYEIGTCFDNFRQFYDDKITQEEEEVTQKRSIKHAVSSNDSLLLKNYIDQDIFLNQKDKTETIFEDLLGEINNRDSVIDEAIHFF